MSDASRRLFASFGYSHEYNPSSPDAELLQCLFGDFTSLQFHVEQWSHDVRTITVEGSKLGLPPIYETFTGLDQSRHRTKRGAMIVLHIDPRGVYVEEMLFIPSAQEGVCPNGHVEEMGHA